MHLTSMAVAAPAASASTTGQAPRPSARAESGSEASGSLQDQYCVVTGDGRRAVMLSAGVVMEKWKGGGCLHTLLGWPHLN